jgi:hypothetical protein
LLLFLLFVLFLYSFSCVETNVLCMCFAYIKLKIIDIDCTDSLWRSLRGRS